ncbi:MAG: internal scaffolding protein [Microvirus sp.]|nr:MAG: internal scaffolding protein [Microvirus sp.]
MARQEQIVKEGKLNEVIIKETIRPNGTLRIQQDFEFCPTLTEQHTAHLTDLNYLIHKYKPDELAAYIAAKNQYKQEILGHDFSSEPSLQDAKNVVYQCKKAFDELPNDIKIQFKNHLEFLKFIDNPANAEKMLKLGLLREEQIEQLTSQEIIKPETAETNTRTTTTQEKKDTAKRKQSSENNEA